MGYIDWYIEKTQKKKFVMEEKKKNYLYWEDLVTETQYGISQEIYDKIYEVGKKELEQCFKDKNLPTIEQIFYHSKGVNDIELFPELPFSGLPNFLSENKNIKKCARICDYVCFRTACLYALKYKSIKNSDNFEQKKTGIRIQGLTWNFVEYPEKCPELEEIEQILKEQIEQIPSQHNHFKFDLLKQKADLVKGGIVKIKQYYLETNKIPEIRGSSSLLESINNKKIEEVICQTHIKECLIYAGGGKMMGIFPEGTGKDICQKIELIIENETITAQSNFYNCSYEIKRLLYDYKKIVDEMDLALEEHQGLRWDFRIDPQIKMKISEKELREKGYNINKRKEQTLCTSCRNRYAIATYPYEDSEESLCQSCLYKRLAGGRSEKRSKLQKYQLYIQKKYGKSISINDTFYNKLEDIAEDGFIGIIYGDANSMSNQINQLNSFMMMRYFSEVTSDTVTNIVFEALFHHLKEKPSFEIIAVGGDDIFLIVPGKYAYDIACTIGEQFDQRFQNQSNCENKITMSIGVCITHDKMPVQYSFEIAQELLKSAKQKSWEEKKKNGTITGTIDWMVIENEGSGNADLEYQRSGPIDKPQKTLRPYTWKQAKAVKEFLCQIKKEKAFVFQLRQSWYQHTQEEAELFYDYQISRKTDQSICQTFCSFAETLGGTAKKNTLLYQETAYSPWLDLIELWDYVEDNNEESGNRDTTDYKIL